VQALYSHCCGLDLHKRSVVACRITPGPDGEPLRETRTFPTTTAALLTLADWLAQAKVTHVAMESTGVYWKPIYNLLEERFQLVLANAAHIKAVPGRKTDVLDAEWIAELLRHGLLSPSYVPPRPQRELRELIRYRTSLVQERAAEINRLQKTLEGANIKLASVVSDIAGQSATQILRSLVRGETDAGTLAQLAKGRLREKIPQLEEALYGGFGAHQRFLVGQQLAHLDDLERSLASVCAEIEKRLGEEPPSPGEPSPPAEGAAGGLPRPVAPGAGPGLQERLMSIPGVGKRTAEALLAEIGTEVSRFPSAKHLSSWAGLAPGNHESGGKRLRGKTRRGNRHVRQILVEAALAAGRTKENYLSAMYRRQVARLGKKRGVIAVAHALVVIVYHLLKKGGTYQELGANYFDEQQREGLERRLVKRLERLGNRVTIERLAAA
jgi:transposase